MLAKVIGQDVARESCKNICCDIMTFDVVFSFEHAHLDPAPKYFTFVLAFHHLVFHMCRKGYELFRSCSPAPPPGSVSEGCLGYCRRLIVSDQAERKV